MSPTPGADTTKDGKKLTARTKVVVGEPVVQVSAPKAFKEIRPGAEIGAPLLVRNSGTVPVRGLGIELRSDAAEFVERHANCRYPHPKLHYGSGAARAPAQSGRRRLMSDEPPPARQDWSRITWSASCRSHRGAPTAPDSA